MVHSRASNLIFIVNHTPNHIGSFLSPNSQKVGDACRVMHSKGLINCWVIRLIVKVAYVTVLCWGECAQDEDCSRAKCKGTMPRVTHFSRYS